MTDEDEQETTPVGPERHSGHKPPFEQAADSAETFESLLKQTKPHAEALRRDDIFDRLKIQNALPDSELQRVTDAILKNRERLSLPQAMSETFSTQAVDALKPQMLPALDLPALDLPEMPPNPTYETNNILDKMERRFADMHRLAEESARITNLLQATTSEFLGKFEVAEKTSKQTAKFAVILGGVAVFIALIMPIIQIYYTELWRVPADQAATEALIQRLETVFDIRPLLREQATVQQQQNALEQNSAEIARLLNLMEDLHVSEANTAGDTHSSETE